MPTVNFEILLHIRPKNDKIVDFVRPKIHKIFLGINCAYPQEKISAPSGNVWGHRVMNQLD